MRDRDGNCKSVSFSSVDAMCDEMTTESKFMLMICQLFLEKARVENSIVVAKWKLPVPYCPKGRAGNCI
ncbi:hypothetical protein DPMN_187228 [Dreissena polymorpha]|uniref:Uncharacterized protein n=1 Tax=Dreissena polymorpha TaxID=45954 RepID=A0A9D4IA90_DREPO|nr:hypothetical protein DPMN_187228 [Dreissena polymorpha]